MTAHRSPNREVPPMFFVALLAIVDVVLVLSVAVEYSR